jgi:hypothetical protein
MAQRIFLGAAWVELQGKRVLQPVNVTNEIAEYQVLGFETNSVIIRDFRPAQVKALQSAIESGQIDRLARKLNAPALVRLYKPSRSQLKIDFHETSVRDPAYRLWIAIGMDGALPVYDYKYELITSYGRDKYAYLGLYSRVYHPTLAVTSFGTLV